MNQYIIGEMDEESRTLSDIRLIPAETKEEAIVIYGHLPSVMSGHEAYKKGEYVSLGEVEYRDKYPALVIRDEVFLNVTEQVTRSFEVKLPSDEDASDTEKEEAKEEVPTKEDVVKGNSLKDILNSIIYAFLMNDKNVPDSKSDDKLIKENMNYHGFEPETNRLSRTLSEFMNSKCERTDLWLAGAIEKLTTPNPFYVHSCILTIADDAMTARNKYRGFATNYLDEASTPVTAIPCISGISYGQMVRGEFVIFIMSIIRISGKGCTNQVAIMFSKVSSESDGDLEELAMLIYVGWLRNHDGIDYDNRSIGCIAALNFVSAKMDDSMWLVPQTRII